MRLILAAILCIVISGGYNAAVSASSPGDSGPAVILLDDPLGISEVVAAAAATSVIITWTTNLPADSRVDYGTAPGSLLWSLADDASVTSHHLMVMNLLQGVTYFFRVTSDAGNGNVAVFPAPPSPPLTFTTIGYDVISLVPDPNAMITTYTPCLTIPVVFTREDATPVRAYSVTISLSENLRLCGAEFASAGYPVPPLLFVVTPLGNNRWTIDETTLGWPCGAAGSDTLFTIDVGSEDLYGTGIVTIESVRVRDCVNDAIPALSGGSVSIPIDIAGAVETPDPTTRARLDPAAPNPFQSSTLLRFHTDGDGPVELAIVSIDGRVVRQLWTGNAVAGEHVATWNGADENGRRLPSGPYMARLRTTAEVRSCSLILLR